MVRLRRMWLQCRCADPLAASGGSTAVTDPNGNTITDSYLSGELASEAKSPNSAGQTST